MSLEEMIERQGWVSFSKQLPEEWPVRCLVNHGYGRLVEGITSSPPTRTSDMTHWKPMESVQC